LALSCAVSLFANFVNLLALPMLAREMCVHYTRYVALATDEERSLKEDVSG
jgi:hypothetical protein